jgi:hypothetical protein
MHNLHIERIEIVIFYFLKNIFFLERIFTFSMRYVQNLVAHAPPMKIEQIFCLIKNTWVLIWHIFLVFDYNHQ